MIWFRNALVLAIGIAGATVLYVAGLEFSALAWLGLWFAGFMAYQSFFAHKLQTWLADPNSHPVPTGHGYWGEMFDGMSRFVSGEANVRSDLAADIERTRALVDQLPNGLMLLGKNNVLNWHNRAAGQLHGVLTIGRPIEQFIRQPEFTRYLRANDFDVPLRCELLARPGRTFEIRIHDLNDGSRVIISRDITEQARLDTMRDEFIANVSHEIRTPVTVIGGFAETMLDLDLEKEKQVEYLNAILKHSHTMQSLVADLLTLSSLEAGIDGVSDDLIDLQALFDVLAAETRDLSGGKHQILAQAPESLTLVGSRTEIESAVRNLLTNAVRYTPEGGEIRLGWVDLDHGGQVTVTDTGIGISPEHLPQLTQRFYRVDRARSRSTGGTGLGLAIVKRIASRHNASLNVASKVGQGSTFSLTFPSTRVRRPA
ncbi:MAG: phosphate regulon sensor histidine kinase PhoR [Burkholderiaceae bacterium]